VLLGDKMGALIFVLISNHTAFFHHNIIAFHKNGFIVNSLSTCLKALVPLPGTTSLSEIGFKNRAMPLNKVKKDQTKKPRLTSVLVFTD